MSSVEPSEQIANLFTSFKENESAVEQLKSSLRKSTQMADQIQQKLHAQKEAVGKMDFEHLRLRKV
jgi:methanogenic corrinoid protein MtbC1